MICTPIINFWFLATVLVALCLMVGFKWGFTRGLWKGTHHRVTLNSEFKKGDQKS